MKFVQHLPVFAMAATMGVALLCPASASAAPSSALNAKFGVCFSCHGAEGKSVLPTYPNLAGQNQAYLVQTLKAFRDGTRPDPVMSVMAKALTDGDITEIAMYFAAIKR